MSLRIASPGLARVRVFDLAGRHVATLLDGSVEAGERELIWDGLDVAGHPVASGVYLARAEAGGEVATRRLVLLK